MDFEIQGCMHAIGCCWCETREEVIQKLVEYEYSPSVTQALKAGNLPGSIRNEFTRDVCSAIRVYTQNPSKMEREYVAFMVIKKFPFLADTIGTGIGSWQTAIKHRFKNLRKTKHDPQRAASVTDPKGPQIKRRKVQGVPDLLEGETEETCKEHIKTLKKEMQKTSNKSQALIKELMDITFPYKRQELMETGVLVEDFLNQYPALQFVSEMKAELARITGEKKCYQNNGRQLDSFATQVVKTGREKLHNKINPGQSKGSGSARSREKVRNRRSCRCCCADNSFERAGMSICSSKDVFG